MTPTPQNKSETVHIRHGVRISGTEQTRIVDRHTSLEELHTLPNVLNMQSVCEGSIQVSPSPSANSHPESNIFVPHMQLIKSLKNAILNDRSFQQEFIEKYEEEILEGIKQKLDQKTSLLSDYMTWNMTFMTTRNIEDWALMRMKRELKLPITVKISNDVLVDRFIANYTFPIVNMKDLNYLKSSSLRKQANEAFHLNVETDEDKMNQIWSVMKDEIKDKETRDRYYRLLQFGKGRGEVKKRGR